MLKRMKNMMAGLLLSGCVFGVNAVGCSVADELACEAAGLECSDQTSGLGAGAEFPLKAVAIS